LETGDLLAAAALIEAGQALADAAQPYIPVFARDHRRLRQALAVWTAARTRLGKGE
jgi:hypothetical protein